MWAAVEIQIQSQSAERFLFHLVQVCLIDVHSTVLSLKLRGGNGEHAHTHTHTHGGLKNKTEINKRMSNCRDRSEGATPTWRDNTDEKGSLESGGERRRWGGSSAVLTLSSKLSLVEEAAPAAGKRETVDLCLQWQAKSEKDKNKQNKQNKKTNYNHFFFFILASWTSAAAVVITFPTRVWT